MTICPSCRAETANDAAACHHCGCSLVGVFPCGIVLADRYEIVAPLGRGGMGIVYHAVDRKLEEPVAIKVLRSDFQDSPEITARFRAEIKLARKVSHRNVCRIYEYGDHGLLHYISMELVTGTDLRSMLKSGPLPLPEAFDVAIQSGQGLDAIHDVGVIHRDLKTSNIMRDQRGIVRLMDFGIAKQHTAGASSMTMTGQIIGTPEYMSPEQARGDRIDYRSDLYSLGIVLFEVFTGRVPFHAPTPLATIFMHMHEPPPLTGPAAAGIPDALRDVLLRALAKEPSGRYASAVEMTEAIRGARAATLGPDRRTTPAPLTGSDVIGTVPATPAPLFTPAPTGGAASAPPPWASPAASSEGAAVRADTTPTPVPQATHVSRRTAPPPRPAPPPPDTGAARPDTRGGAASRTAAVVGIAALAILGTVGVVAWQKGQGVAPGTSSPAIPTLAASAVPETPEAPTVGGTLGGSGALAVATPSPVPRFQPTPASPPAVAAVPEPPTPLPAEPAEPAAPAPGMLQVVVKPWAEVFVDGRSRGTTPLPKFELPPGSHTVRLVHPSFRPLQRVLRVRAGETTNLEVDLSWEAVPVGPPS